MAQQFLHGADVAARLKKMGGEAVAQRVGCGRLGDARLPHCALEGALEGVVVEVMARDDATAWIGGQPVLRKEPEPAPAAARPWVLAFQRVRQLDAGLAGRRVSAPDQAAAGQLRTEVGHQAVGQHHHAVLAALAFAHGNGALGKVQVFHAQPQALGDPQAGAVQKPGQQRVLALQVVEYGGNLVGRQHPWQAPFGDGPADLGHPGQRQLQHLAVEEQQGRQCLPVRGGGDVALRCQVDQKGLDLILAHVGRMRSPWKRMKAL